MLVQGSRFTGPPRRPLAGVRVRFTSGNSVVETVTDHQGRYDVSGLPEGIVRIEPVLPDQLVAESGGAEVRAGGCAVHVVVAEWNGRIRGRVIPPDRTPMTWMVDLVPADPRREGFERGGRYVRADDKGEYEFTGVPPGEYLVGVNLRRSPGCPLRPRTSLARRGGKTLPRCPLARGPCTTASTSRCPQPWSEDNWRYALWMSPVRMSFQSVWGPIRRRAARIARRRRVSSFAWTSSTDRLIASGLTSKDRRASTGSQTS